MPSFRRLFFCGIGATCLVGENFPEVLSKFRSTEHPVSKQIRSSLRTLRRGSELGSQEGDGPKLLGKSPVLRVHALYGNVKFPCSLILFELPNSFLDE
jgi:hypothetical protein